MKGFAMRIQASLISAVGVCGGREAGEEVGDGFGELAA